MQSNRVPSGLCTRPVTETHGTPQSETALKPRAQLTVPQQYGRVDETRHYRVDPVGFTSDKDGSIHSPLLFLLANTLPNNLLNFRILDLVVAGWLHSLEKVEKKLKKYKNIGQNPPSKFYNHYVFFGQEKKHPLQSFHKM